MPEASEIWEYLKNAGPAAILTFILGFLISRWTMTKKERADYQQKLFENTTELMDRQHNAYQEYTNALRHYREATTIESLFDLATAGEKYFYQAKIISDAILTGKVDENARDHTLVPRIKRMVEETLPIHYSYLQEIAEKKQLSYYPELKRENFESLYRVVEQYGNLERVSFSGRSEEDD